MQIDCQHTQTFKKLSLIDRNVRHFDSVHNGPVNMPVCKFVMSGCRNFRFIMTGCRKFRFIKDGHFYSYCSKLVNNIQLMTFHEANRGIDQPMSHDIHRGIRAYIHEV